MLRKIRENIIQLLWNRYCASNSSAQKILQHLTTKNSSDIILDHFAIIDLPSTVSGITPLQEMFSLLGYHPCGQDYLPAKQNDFAWLAEQESAKNLATAVLPQIVIADFRLEEMPVEVRVIIEKYAQQTHPAPTDIIQPLLHSLTSANARTVIDIVTTYLAGRDWPLPTLQEFYTVQEFNELLAWVLVFGRKPNHFTLSVHLLSPFHSLPHFLQFIEQEVHLPLNKEGEIIKGGPTAGIAQASTQEEFVDVQLADGVVQLPQDFVEFVWRYPMKEIDKPVLWGDYFTGFIAQHADRVVESLYV